MYSTDSGRVGARPARDRGAPASSVVPDDGVVRILQKAGNTNVQLVNLRDVNHVYKEVSGVPNSATDYTNPDLPFSREAADKLAAFAKAALR